MRSINGESIEEFAKLIVKAYTEIDFSQFLQSTYNHDLDYYSSNGKSLQRYIETCHVFWKEGGDEGFCEFVKAIVNHRHKRKEFQDFYENFCCGLDMTNNSNLEEKPHTTTLQPSKKSEVEKNIHPERGDREPLALAAWLPNAVSKVCQIRIGDKPIGTGFLVGCDLVLTAYHNISPIINERKYHAEDVRFVFGYVFEKDKITLQKSIAFNLQPFFLLAHSPSEPSEVNSHINAVQDPTTKHLDYALLWVVNLLGTQTENDIERKWFYIFEPLKLPEIQSYLYLLHHPEGKPMKWSEGDKIIRLSNSKSRVDYFTNTERGSSGAPCFNKEGELIAMHNYGEVRTRHRFNRGIPISTIAKDLNKKKFIQFLMQNTHHVALPQNIGKIPIKLRKNLSNAYPFLNQLNKQIDNKPKLRENKTQLTHALYMVFLLRYTDIEYPQSYWLFMIIGLHISIIGDFRMNNANYDQLFALYEKIGFDDLRLKNQIQKLELPKGSLENLESNVNLDDHYGNRQVVQFFQQLSEIVLVRWQFVMHLHDSWPKIYMGSQIIDHSKDCLHAIREDIGYTIGLFHMYEKVSASGWSLNEEAKFREFTSLSEDILDTLTELGNEFNSLKRKLSSDNLENILPVFESQYVKLDFFISDYLDVIQELISISAGSFQ